MSRTETGVAATTQCDDRGRDGNPAGMHRPSVVDVAQIARTASDGQLALGGAACEEVACRHQRIQRKWARPLPRTG